MNSTSSSSSSSESSSSGIPPSPPKKMRIFNDLYEVTNLIDNDVTLYCYLATCDPIVFEEAINNEKIKIVMNEEIALIEKK